MSDTDKFIIPDGDLHAWLARATKGEELEVYRGRADISVLSPTSARAMERALARLWAHIQAAELRGLIHSTRSFVGYTSTGFKLYSLTIRCCVQRVGLNAVRRRLATLHA